jgi:hypothetical protein
VQVQRVVGPCEGEREMDGPAADREGDGRADASRHTWRRMNLLKGARDVSRFEHRDGAARSSGLTAMGRMPATVDMHGLSRGQRRDDNGDRQERTCDTLRGNHADDCGPIG